MTALEFSNEFDLLYNNITSNQAPGLDNYEKSVFLTKAQNEIVKAYFNPRLNKTQEGFDGNAQRQIDFSMILKTVVYDKLGNNSEAFESKALLDNKENTERIAIESDIMMFVNEFADVKRDILGNGSNKKSVRLTVVPLDYKDYARLMSKPYKRPTQYQAWRVIDNSEGTNKVEIIIGGNDELQKYTIRYIKTPYPIILEALDGDITIDGKKLPYSSSSTIKYVPIMTTDSTGKEVQQMDSEGNPMFKGIQTPILTDRACELDPILHPEILQRGVELAKAAWIGDLNSQLILGSASQTSIGGGGVPQQQR